MHIETKDFIVAEREVVDVTSRPTLLPPRYKSEDDYEDELEEKIEAISKLQQRLYASDSEALLVILQAMDTGGKDGIIRHVLSGITPFGIRVSSFGRPSPIELN